MCENHANAWTLKTRFDEQTFAVENAYEKQTNVNKNAYEKQKMHVFDEQKHARACPRMQLAKSQCENMLHQMTIAFEPKRFSAQKSILGLLADKNSQCSSEKTCLASMRLKKTNCFASTNQMFFCTYVPSG